MPRGGAWENAWVRSKFDFAEVAAECVAVAEDLNAGVRAAGGTERVYTTRHAAKFTECSCVWLGPVVYASGLACRRMDPGTQRQPVAMSSLPQPAAVREPRSAASGRLEPVERLPGTRGSFYRPELDVLRFFAFLGVYQFHSYVGARAVENGPRWIALANRLNYAGLFGVDLFFVLSAYLITELLLREKRQFGRLNIRAFYIRRILRIWPLYFFAIGLGLIPFLNGDHAFAWRYYAPFLLLAGNWSIVAWGWPPGNVIVGHLWTISVEEQFYLLWPPIVRIVSTENLAFVAIAMLALANTMRTVMIGIHAGSLSIWCNTLCRLDPIALGILLAVVLRGRIPNFGIGTRLGMLLGGALPVILVANCWNLASPKALEWVPDLVGFPIVAVGCTLILLATLGSSVRPHGALIYLGKISYGLYVYHFLGMYVTRNFLIRGHMAHFRLLVLRQTVALAITVLLASLSYVLLEKPFLNLKKRFELVRSRPV